MIPMLRNLAVLAAVLVIPAISRGQAAPADGRPALELRKDPKPPVAPEGWKVETVLLSPQIESPSVVCALPDGRVLIGEDPLDNHGGKDPIDRIVCLWPDGKLTVWADKLNPVFGLAYLDGKVFVHQYPILSVYDDIDGKAANRKDLINQTGKPTIGGLNDHIPAQIRLAMDGYFYMAVGDRGVWGAKSNIDGSEAELPGGGLLRFKPDGTKLEVYSTGTRNHLDVSMTSEDEKFTYDNTDDGHGWWTRFTHMVDGGYYGYPWDYKAPENKNDPNSRKAPQGGLAEKPYQPYTLWRMAEYGGGSPCGAIGYTEDALPPEFRDNLFHCDWGKGKVQRFQVSRDSGTFKVDQMTDFLSPGGDLRPLGIDITADGLGFWVTDWGYGGWHQKKPEVGRLIKVTWTGKNHATPKPEWYVPAAMGKKFDATTAELIEGLKHPARSVRMVAQRRLAEKGDGETVKALGAIIQDNGASPAARWHAIWAIHGMHPADSKVRIRILGDAAELVGAKNCDASVRRQIMRLIGEERLAWAARDLKAALADADAAIRFQAATILGRLGSVEAVPSALTALDSEKDLFARFALFTALHRIGKANPDAWPAIVAGIEGDSDAVRANVTYALRNTYDSKLVDALVKLAFDKTKPAVARSTALLSAADLHRQPKPWGGNWWATQPVGNPRPPKVVDWEGTTTVLNAIRDLAKDADPAVRAAAVKAMVIAPDPGNAELLVNLFGQAQDVETRTLILKALTPAKSGKAVELATAVLKDPKAPAALIPDAIAILREAGAKDAVPVLISLVENAALPEVIEPAMDTLGSLKAKEGVPAIAKRIAATEPQIWNGAINALQSINDKTAIEALIVTLKDKRTDVRKNAVVALGQMKAKDAVPAMVEAVQTKKVSGDGLQALSRIPDVRALDVYLNTLADKNRGFVRDARGAVEKIKAEALPLIEQRLAEGKIKPEAIVVLQEIYAKDRTSKLFDPKFAPAVGGAAKGPDAFAAFAMANPGDAAKGKAVFNGQAAACMKCHQAVQNEGGLIGPSLVGVGGKYDRAKLVESVVYPSKQIFDGFQQTIIKTKDDDVIAGIVKSESEAEIEIYDSTAARIVVKKADVKTRKHSELSAMPEGLEQAMSPQEFADLIAYLASLKEGGTPPPAKK
ncbi:HEAT repeat domain-containing protein [Humisphaera borealis]|uniref:HEAT repeat domain-containing protein n=1 Tax=Humisphaera borealis TaxID=2807512 RepID=A0A7M2WYL8_9BACT|nr:HEAT repeat domain-containing protein [Humisphaera borealis]QOV90454.1 HEAT repeat domain-containing protein [Humisphaera borealis]